LGGEHVDATYTIYAGNRSVPGYEPSAT